MLKMFSVRQLQTLSRQLGCWDAGLGDAAVKALASQT